jgi:hypothetical protein
MITIIAVATLFFVALLVGFIGIALGPPGDLQVGGP